MRIPRANRHTGGGSADGCPPHPFALLGDDWHDFWFLPDDSRQMDDVTLWLPGIGKKPRWRALTGPDPIIGTVNAENRALHQAWERWQAVALGSAAALRKLVGPFIVAEQLDADPFVLFHIRGRTREEVLAWLRRGIARTVRRPAP